MAKKHEEAKKAAHKKSQKVELSAETQRAVEEGNKIREQLLGGAENAKKSQKAAEAADKKQSSTPDSEAAKVKAKLKEQRTKDQKKNEK